ncbi:DUF4365 domain-containing protein [Nocardia suismassiliense]|uniref:DUF4365 domain-containing protein n=1 Tax=Nocardia suismassiliense TaxID=2077092 RepID=UPI000D1DCBD3|nr:DUF4365 domain-containing protein [Nocardia suismassiliense]
MVDVDGRGSLQTESAAPTLDGGLPMTARQEQFSVAFIRMVAAAAGCSIKGHETDHDGVDITIVASAEYAKYYCPEFEMQLKCTTQSRLLQADHLAWSLKRDHFLKLVSPKRFAPAILGVLLIPEDPDQLLDLSEAGLTTSSRMYWQHAKKLGEIEDGKASKTVHLPRSNLFDVGSLQGIMQVIGEGGQW